MRTLIASVSAHKLVVLLTLCSGPIWAAQAQASTISGLVIFDSSLSATPFGPPVPPDYGYRSTNGPVWVDYLADFLNVPAPVGHLLGGKNYSNGGATLEAGWPHVGGQVDLYLTQYAPDPNELFILSGSQNNFYESSGEEDPSVSVAQMVGHVTALANAGAQHFMIATVSLLGQAPAFDDFRDTPFPEFSNQWAFDNNALMRAAMDELQLTLGIDVSYADRYAVDSAMVANPSAFGLTNVTDPANDDGVIVPNPDEYMYWDLIHPTTVAHYYLALDGFADLEQEIGPLIPEPSTFVMSAMGLLSLLVIARRKRLARMS